MSFTITQLKQLRESTSYPQCQNGDCATIDPADYRSAMAAKSTALNAWCEKCKAKYPKRWNAYKTSVNTGKPMKDSPEDRKRQGVSSFYESTLHESQPFKHGLPARKGDLVHREYKVAWSDDESFADDTMIQFDPEVFETAVAASRKAEALSKKAARAGGRPRYYAVLVGSFRISSGVLFPPEVK